MNLPDVRAFAATLPGTTEEPHFERWSFRVGGKIYAAWGTDGASVNVFVDAEGVQGAVAREPGAVSELWWGKSLSGVTVRLDAASREHVEELLVASWRRRAPKRVAAAFDAARKG